MSEIALAVDQQRHDGSIGASEAAACLGLDPYTSPITMNLRLRGKEVERNRPDYALEAMAWGNALEPIVRGRYALQTQTCLVVPKQSLVMDEWLRATPDGIVMQKSIQPQAMQPGESIEMDVIERHLLRTGFSGLVQIKTCSRHAWEGWGGCMPPHHEIQARVEMAVCGLPWDDMAYLVGGQRMVVQRVERNLTIEAKLVADLHAFWKQAQAGHEPPPDASDAYRDLASSRMRSSRVTMEASDEVRMLIEQLNKDRIERKTIEAREAENKTRLLLYMGGAGATKIDGGAAGQVTAYPVKGRVDWRRYAEILGGTKDGAEAHRAQCQTWGLRLSGGDDHE